MGAIRYEPDYAGTQELMNSPEMLALVTEAAEFGRGFAEAIAPHGKTGDYAASFDVSARTHAGPDDDRAEALLANTSGHAIEVELRNHGGQFILSRTAEAIEARYR